MSNHTAVQPPVVNPGLEGVFAASTACSFIDGRQGRLVYRGYDIEDLCQHSTYEETAFLLWYGTLPTDAELQRLASEMAAQRELPEPVVEVLRLAPRSADPMDVLRTAVSALGMYDPETRDRTAGATLRKSIRLTSQVPTVVAYADRIQRGLDPVAPDPGLSLAANFLYMLKGQRPDDEVARIFDVCLILHIEHGLNASTFSARVTASTLSDLHSAITSAVGTLKGPLHGGANEGVMAMLQEIGTPEQAHAHVERLLAAHDKVMGFGHRVYRTLDPRAAILRSYSRALGEAMGDSRWYEISEAIVRAMHALKPDIYPNVDFYSASVYYTMGIEIDLFTPVFAISRMAGWTAQLLEQYSDNRIMRPDSAYVGPMDLKYLPIDQR